MTSLTPVQTFDIQRQTYLAERNLRLEKTYSSQMLTIPNLLMWLKRIENIRIEFDKTLMAQPHPTKTFDIPKHILTWLKVKS